VIFTLLNVFHREMRELGPSQAAPKQDAKYGAVSLAAESCHFRSVNQRAALFRRQPVAEPDAELLGAFNAPDSGREPRAQQPCVRCLVSQASPCRQSLLDCRRCAM